MTESTNGLLHLTAKMTIASQGIPRCHIAQDFNNQDLKKNNQDFKKNNQDFKKRLVAGVEQVASQVLEIISKMLVRIPSKVRTRVPTLNMSATEANQLNQLLGAKFWGSTKLTSQVLSVTRLPPRVVGISGKTLFLGWWNESKETKEAKFGWKKGVMEKWNICTAFELVNLVLNDLGWLLVDNTRYRGNHAPRKFKFTIQPVSSEASETKFKFKMLD
jgi:hypothetical protein